MLVVSVARRFIRLRQRKQLLIEHLERWLSPSRIEGHAPRSQNRRKIPVFDEVMF
jgi:hypothetical protein